MRKACYANSLQSNLQKSPPISTQPQPENKHTVGTDLSQQNHSTFQGHTFSQGPWCYQCIKNSVRIRGGGSTTVSRFKNSRLRNFLLQAQDFSWFPGHTQTLQLKLKNTSRPNIKKKERKSPIPFPPIETSKHEAGYRKGAEVPGPCW